jgi:creatinine amidohydrolase
VTQWHEMATMTSVELKAALPEIELALLPVGATEQHGANLALGTDYVAAHRIAQRIAARVHPRALVVPPIPFGLSHHHTGFTGTITLSPETFSDVCVETARSLARDGLRHLLLVNGHNGNMGVLNVAATRIRYEVGIECAVAFYFAQAADRVRQHGKTPRYGHACEIETSVLLYLAPELVRKEALEPGEMIDQDRALHFNNQPFALQVPIPFDRQTRNGVFGDARLADVEIGRDIVETAIERTLTFIESFLREPARDAAST